MIYNKYMILGIDEVGRGPWAGPLVVGAVVLGGSKIEGLTDSKKLSKKRREILDVIIRAQASGFGLGWVMASEIDEIGLSAALKLATIRAVEQVKTSYNEIIIDGTVNFLKETTKGPFVTTMKKADLLVPSVSAASIIAKVARDNFMAKQDDIYPGYGFKSHVGYGTAAHIQAIADLGVTPLHRLSFSPLSKYKTTDIRPNNPPVSKAITTRQIGDSGEDEACLYLINKGHEIIDRNWKTKFCEIDIVSKYQNIIYFTEVKYRKNAAQGGGLAAITPAKLRQMNFAVKLYAAKNHLNNIDLRLAALAVSGQPPVVEAFLEII